MNKSWAKNNFKSDLAKFLEDIDRALSPGAPAPYAVSGKQVVPVHHTAQAYTDEYVERAGLAADPKGPLFRSASAGRRTDQLTSRPLTRENAAAMMKRRAKSAGLPTQGCAHSFRGTGITEYLRAGGALETAARIAGHESTRTAQLHSRLPDEVALDEIERIHI